MPNTIPYQTSSLDRSSRLVGTTTSIELARQKIERFAQTRLPILISGETGVGKDYVARDIHRLSMCSEGPYVAVNCGTLLPNLAVAELFGSRRGAFTGAVDRVGLLQQANGGSLFLDEIGDLPLEVQIMLLRALESGTFRVLGSQTDIQSDFRLICASHIDLQRACKHHQFRWDLYYRISMMPIEIPPLRQRKPDLEQLIDLVCPGVRPRLHDSSLSSLKAHTFPGNLRELRNILTSSKALYQGRWIMPEDLCIQRQAERIVPEVRLSLAGQITQYVHLAFLRYDCNIRQTARALEVSPNTVYRYLALHRSHAV